MDTKHEYKLQRTFTAEYTIENVQIEQCNNEEKTCLVFWDHRGRGTVRAIFWNGHMGIYLPIVEALNKAFMGR